MQQACGATCTRCLGDQRSLESLATSCKQGQATCKVREAAVNTQCNGIILCRSLAGWLAHSPTSCIYEQAGRRLVAGPLQH